MLWITDRRKKCTFYISVIIAGWLAKAVAISAVQICDEGTGPFAFKDSFTHTCSHLLERTPLPALISRSCSSSFASRRAWCSSVAVSPFSSADLTFVHSYSLSTIASVTYDSPTFTTFNFCLAICLLRLSLFEGKAPNRVRNSVNILRQGFRQPFAILSCQSPQAQRSTNIEVARTRVFLEP